MTVLVSVKINDGVVMAADSASSFASGMIYHHAQKIVNLRKGLPIGAMVTGAGGIGNESIDTLLKDLRRRFRWVDRSRLRRSRSTRLQVGRAAAFLSARAQRVGLSGGAEGRLRRDHVASILGSRRSDSRLTTS